MSETHSESYLEQTKHTIVLNKTHELKKTIDDLTKYNHMLQARIKSGQSKAILINTFEVCDMIKQVDPGVTALAYNDCNILKDVTKKIQGYGGLQYTYYHHAGNFLKNQCGIVVNWNASSMNVCDVVTHR